MRDRPPHPTPDGVFFILLGALSAVLYVVVHFIRKYW